MQTTKKWYNTHWAHALMFLGAILLGWCGGAVVCHKSKPVVHRCHCCHCKTKCCCTPR